MKHFSENVKIRQTCVNQAVFKSSSFVLPYPLSRIRRVPSELWQQEYSKEKYNCFSQKFSQVQCNRALKKQHLPVLKKLFCFTPKSKHYSALCFFRIFLKPLLLTNLLLGNKISLQSFCLIIQKSEMKITWALGLLPVVLSLWLFSHS